MTMAFSPIGRPDEQPLIGHCGILMAVAIAEQPRAEIRRFRIACGQRKRAAAALKRLVAPTAMEQRLGQTTVQYSRIRGPAVAASK